MKRPTVCITFAHLNPCLQKRTKTQFDLLILARRAAGHFMGSQTGPHRARPHRKRAVRSSAAEPGD